MATVKKTFLMTMLGFLLAGKVCAEPMMVKSEIVAFSIPESSVVGKIESRTNQEVVGILSDTLGFKMDSFNTHSDGVTLHNRLHEKGGMLFGVVNLFMELNNQTESVFQYPIFDFPNDVPDAIASSVDAPDAPVPTAAASTSTDASEPGSDAAAASTNGPGDEAEQGGAALDMTASDAVASDAMGSGPENSEPDWDDLPGMKLLLTARELKPEHSRFRLDYAFEIGLIPPDSEPPTDGQKSAQSPITRHTIEESIEVELEKWYVITVSTVERVADGSVHQIWILIRLHSS